MWGTHSLTVAIRALLKQALQEPLNQRFALMSEWDIPLYPPSVLYVQLMSEERSRIKACPTPLVRQTFQHLCILRYAKNLKIGIALHNTSVTKF